MTDNPKTHAALTALILDLGTIGQPREWKHKDGRTLTDEERALLMGSTVDDVRAALAAANDFNQHRRERSQQIHDFHDECISYRHAFGALVDTARYAFLYLVELAEHAKVAGTVLTLEALTGPDSVLDALIDLISTEPGEQAYFDYEGADVITGHLRDAAEAFAAGRESLRRAARPQQ